MNKLKLFLITGLIVGFIFITGVVNAGDVYVMKFAFQMANDIYGTNEASFANAFKGHVESASNGRIKVELYPGGVMGKERENFVNVKNNVIQATLSSVGGIAQFYKPITVVDIPFAFKTHNIAWQVYDGWFGDELRADILDKTGVRCLVTTETGGFFAFTNNKHEVKTPEDMKGLKYRTMENQGHIKMISLLGGSAVPIAWLELYTSLQTGVIDGQMNPLPTILSGKLEEVQKYVTLTNHLYGTDWFMVNNDWFESLPEDLQKIVKDAAEVANIADRGAQRLLDVQAIQKLKEAGLQIYTPTVEEKEMFRNKVQDGYIDWLSQEVDQQWIDKFLKAVDEAESE
ncbi:DctP family TRAP transporter solute-binding subunit [Iocasia frigidifontis]|uniref:DctP family TRAP transporter solute-binding subunit n=1 Tax=Iocasia fonsfrigidae TaxID=2682810 RepID=A0A8A7KI07_9FIRM|nr:DctP family TRAP transporter solute-binding subunit [Iocasia fonsfrigidae]QTL97512.1 DctP family TRAP transporter solute-binding subunit [Iocasia fonsfrigidae]